MWLSGQQVMWKGDVGTVRQAGSFLDGGTTLTHNRMVWSGLRQEYAEAYNVPVGELRKTKRPEGRRASALAVARQQALDERHDWRDPPPNSPAMMRQLCEVRPSGAMPREELPGSVGLGVFALAYIPDDTRLFWRLGGARLLPEGKLDVALRRYAMFKSAPSNLFACPGVLEWSHRDARDAVDQITTLGFGWRVNFAGMYDVVNVRLEHAGNFGDSLCFRCLCPVNPGDELLFDPGFHNGVTSAT